MRARPDRARAIGPLLAQGARPHGGDRLRSLQLALGLPAPLGDARLLPAALGRRRLGLDGVPRRHHVPAPRRRAAERIGTLQGQGARRHSQRDQAADVHAQLGGRALLKALRHVLHGLAVLGQRDARARAVARAGDWRGAHVGPHRRRHLCLPIYLQGDDVPHRPAGRTLPHRAQDGGRHVDGEHRAAEHPGAHAHGDGVLHGAADAVGD
mmetsp:Transcript_31079/g.85043  ORF Transcript_31079/g.85043 Transcript_31079/m.85043 type:complete len:210 (+) Transcript_31079:857-1486(+)